MYLVCGGLQVEGEQVTSGGGSLRLEQPALEGARVAQPDEDGAAGGVRGDARLRYQTVGPTGEEVLSSRLLVEVTHLPGEGSVGLGYSRTKR